MKLGNLIWVLALAGAAAACNSGPVVAGCSVDPVTGRCSTEGGECGPLVDACINPADAAAYSELTYTDQEGIVYMGPAASSAIGSDCIFGTTTSDPPLPGCGGQSFAVVECFPNCEPEVIQAAADCVADCTQTATGLSDECVSCTGDTVACGAAFCTNLCIRDTNDPTCVECRCNNNCVPCFDLCSGLDPTTTCD
jgi:hypothetical protein